MIDTIKKEELLRILLNMVEVTGIEPATSWSQTTRATNCATPRNKHLLKGTYLLYHKNMRFAIFFLNFFKIFITIVTVLYINLNIAKTINIFIK